MKSKLQFLRFVMLVGLIAPLFVRGVQGQTATHESAERVLSNEETRRFAFPTKNRANGLKDLQWYAHEYRMEVMTARISTDDRGEHGKWTSLLVGTEASSAPSFVDERFEYWSALRILSRENKVLKVTLYHTHPSEYVRRFARGELMPHEEKEAKVYNLSRATFDPARPFGTPPSPNDVEALRDFTDLMGKVAERLAIKIVTAEGIIDETGEWTYAVCKGGVCEDAQGVPYARESSILSIREVQVAWAKFINATALRGREVLESKELRDTIRWYALHGVRLSYRPFD